MIHHPSRGRGGVGIVKAIGSLTSNAGYLPQFIMLIVLVVVVVVVVWLVLVLTSSMWFRFTSIVQHACDQAYD